MSPTYEFPRTLDVAALAAVDQDARQISLLRSMLEQLASCEMGRKLLNVALDHRLTFRFGTARSLRDGRGQFGGMYRSASNVIEVLDGADFEWQVMCLAHELQHFVDHMLGWTVGSVQGEVRARQTEALVIRQLRLRLASWALDAAGELVSPVAIAARVRRHPLYRTNSEELQRYDGRIHPLVDASELMPRGLTVASPSGGMRIGAIAPVAITSSISPVTRVSTAPVTQAAHAALGARTPTGWDPEAAMQDTSIEQFLATLDARRLATGA